MSYSDLRSSFAVEAPHAVANVGKIYLYNNYLFVNEINKGVHVIDYSNPANLQDMAFIKIPGNVDIAIKNNILYADSFVDLVAIDITNPLVPVQLTRIPDFFPYPYYYADNMQVVYTNTYSNAIFDAIDITLGIVIDWVYSHDEVIQAAASACGSLNYSSTPLGALVSSASQTGVGGSLSRFTIEPGTQNYLYALNSTDLKVVDITTANTPTLVNTITVGMELQSLFINNNHLFVSSQSAINIYDVSIPLNPSYISQFTHETGCSPVIASGNYMYATSRTGNTSCYNSSNILSVIDISNINTPVEFSSYNLVNPFGLTIDSLKNVLIVCDGTSGLKLFDTTATPYLSTIGTAIPSSSGDELHDIILNANQAFVVGGTAIYLYDTTNIVSGVMPLSGSLPITP